MTSNVDFITGGLELVKRKSDVYPVPEKIIEKKNLFKSPTTKGG